MTTLICPCCSARLALMNGYLQPLQQQGAQMPQELSQMLSQPGIPQAALDYELAIQQGQLSQEQNKP